MRLYLAPVTGTGYPIVTQLDPPYEQDMYGVDITEIAVRDPVRPDTAGEIVQPSTCTLVVRPRPSAIDRFLVLDSGQMDLGTPTGCENVVGGNSAINAQPEAVVQMNTPLNNGRKNTLEDFLGQPRGTFETDGTNWTPRRLVRWMVGPGWKQKVGLFTLRSDEP